MASEEIVVGAGASIDSTAIVGYRPGRKIDDLTLSIGPDAKLRAGTIVYLGARIGRGFETGHNVVVREQVTIGDDCRIWNATTIDYGVRIGHRVKIHCNGYVAQLTTIEDDVFIAPGLVVANDMYPESRDLVGPTIGKGAKIGCNVTLLPGVRIGAGALIGAGTVVVKDVPAGAVVVGNPARVVKKVDDIPAYRERAKKR